MKTNNMFHLKHLHLKNISIDIWGGNLVIVVPLLSLTFIFQEKEADEDRDTQYFIHVSYVEIYNEEIRDLLSDTPENKLEIKGNIVKGL